MTIKIVEGKKGVGKCVVDKVASRIIKNLFWVAYPSSTEFLSCLLFC